jgi:hypothetical protein
MIAEADFNAQIAEAGSILNGILGKIEGMKADIATEKVEGAVSKFEATKKAVDIKKIDLKQAIRARQEKYEEFAKAAGEAAGGGEAGAKVQAAMEAIPVVEAVLARIRPIVTAIQLPAYSDDSGIGFRAAGGPVDFTLHLGQLKGYKEAFDGHHQLWTGRLQNLQKAATGLLSSGQPAKP